MLFVRAARRAAWVTLFGATACASTHEDPASSQAGWKPIPCHGQSDSADYELANLKLAVDVDYIAVHRAEPNPPAPQTHGKACAQAANQEACAEELAALVAQHTPEGRECDDFCGAPPLYVLTTHGDEVKSWSGEDELRDLLGRLDGANEALLWLGAVEARYFQCGDVMLGATRSAGDGTLVRWYGELEACNPYVEGYDTDLVSADGKVSDHSQDAVLTEPDGCVQAGRRPPGLVPPEHDVRNGSLARFFAKLAHLEAASVPAFEALEHELLALGAPASLIRKVREAAADEREHARDMAALAARFGGEPSPVTLSPTTARDLFALALDNAVEGCVREAFGAALATYQALHARDQGVRTLMKRIAEDETRHAGLSFQLAAWLEPQLTADERAALRAAQARAVAEIRAELNEPLPHELVRIAGMPEPRAARVLMAELELTLLLAPRLAA